MNRRLFLAAVVLALGPPLARAQETAPPIVIVVNERLGPRPLSREELRNVFLGKQAFWPGNVAVKIFDRPVDREAALVFYRDVLKMVPARFRHHWQSQQLAGKGIAPETIASADEVVARVAAAPGGISYLHESEAPKGAKGVLVIAIAPERTQD